MTTLPPFHLHGSGPAPVCVLHGGPGALGSARGLALDIAALGHSVFEPFGTGLSIEAQITDHLALIRERCARPAVLVGHSWGALLALMLAARALGAVSALILVGCPPLSGGHGPRITTTRLERLLPEKRAEFMKLAERLGVPGEQNADALMQRLGQVILGADILDPLPGALDAQDHVQVSFEVFRAIWAEAQDMRASGELSELAARVRCPVAVIHGDYDPHPAGDVRESLERVLPQCRFSLIKSCGHYPWLERKARQDWLECLNREVATALNP